MTQNVHLIFKTHLDVGFTDYASCVINNYFKKYIPTSLRVARQMRDSDRQEGFIWTTGSWLIYEYLEQANNLERAEMEAAIELGEIAWHALPFTTHTELMDPELFRFGLSLSQSLDKRFGKKTIAAKMTDVPGHTRGIVPLLVEAGVTFLHIGVNPASTVPNVPPLFRWQDDSGAELIVMYESGYGSAFVIDGIEDSLAFGHTGDNLGPQSPDQVLDVYREYRATFPGANIFASTLDQFAEKLEPVRNNLPVVTDEIGDTWIHGVGSDPIKVSRYRELLRLRCEWLESKKVNYNDKRFINFNRRLLLVPEHTWGMDERPSWAITRIMLLKNLSSPADCPILKNLNPRGLKSAATFKKRSMPWKILPWQKKPASGLSEYVLINQIFQNGKKQPARRLNCRLRNLTF